jgi:mono/diheme cytochrome c family protein
VSNSKHSLAKAIILGLAAFAAATPAMAADAEHGHAVFLKWCAPCHGPGIGNNGAPAQPAVVALQAKYNGTLPALIEQRTDLQPDFIKVVVRNGITIMPFSRKTEISDHDLDDLVSWLTRNNK